MKSRMIRIVVAVLMFLAWTHVSAKINEIPRPFLSETPVKNDGNRGIQQPVQESPETDVLNILTESDLRNAPYLFKLRNITIGLPCVTETSSRLTATPTTQELFNKSVKNPEKYTIVELTLSNSAITAGCTAVTILFIETSQMVPQLTAVRASDLNVRVITASMHCIPGPGKPIEVPSLGEVFEKSVMNAKKYQIRRIFLGRDQTMGCSWATYLFTEGPPPR